MPQVNYKEVIALLNKGYTLANLAGLTDEQMEALYALGYQYYQVGNYKDAKNIFTALCLYDCHEPKYFMGLGGCLQGLGEYKNAADTYSVACTITGLIDPEPMYFAAICLLKNNDKDNAMVALQSIALMGRKDNKNDELFKKKAQDLLSVLKSK